MQHWALCDVGMERMPFFKDRRGNLTTVKPFFGLQLPGRANRASLSRRVAARVIAKALMCLTVPEMETWIV